MILVSNYGSIASSRPQGGGGGGTSIPVSVVWSSDEPSSWNLDVTDKDGVVVSLSESNTTADIDFTKDGSTRHAYSFYFSDTLNQPLSVNSPNGIDYFDSTGSSEDGDPDVDSGTGITIDSSSTSLVFTIDATLFEF
jgi:hypothetical protein